MARTSCRRSTKRGGPSQRPTKSNRPRRDPSIKLSQRRFAGTLGEGPKKESGISSPEQPYGRVQFGVTKDRITPQTFQVLPGPLIASNTIDGEWMYAATIDNQPVAVGTFRDPLTAVALPFEKEQGYLAIPQAEGQFAISLPARTAPTGATARIAHHVLPSRPRDSIRHASDRRDRRYHTETQRAHRERRRLGAV